MANNIDKKEPVAICDQSKIDVTKCDNHELAGNIEPLIKVIRGQQVMLDKDLATLYGVETRVLNQTVKRNIERFPAHPTNPVEGCADANPKTELPNDT